MGRWLQRLSFVTDPENSNRISCLELYGLRMPPNADLVLIYDIINLDIRRIGKTDVFPVQLVIRSQNTDIEALAARGANTLDPLVTFLKLLNDASIQIIDHPAPIKLNKMRSNRAILDPGTQRCQGLCLNLPSIQIIKREGPRRSSASPVAHSRRAHLRQLKSGRVIPVRDSKVNWRSAEELHRLFIGCRSDRQNWKKEEKRMKDGKVQGHRRHDDGLRYRSLHQLRLELLVAGMAIQPSHQRPCLAGDMTVYRRPWRR